MTIEFPAPTGPAADRAEVFVRYLEYFRETLLEKAAALPPAELRSSRLPSGWTPLELVKHLRHVERRWIEWGFQGRDVGDPWADRRDDRWYVGESETLAGLAAELRAQGAHTAAVATGTDLAAVGEPGERWEGADPATLERVLFHLLQEYARHVGHLDIVTELATGRQGE
ncbi:DinB family protein [Actinoplanes sp. DH11]|uniref:DinB family protein n=1 Tax=Actinoplanes sp. DH11 TaxID=2857011 RepID=UPI001E3FBD96|nr:DinB family protein [Actinoplanes sp. DH11]